MQWMQQLPLCWQLAANEVGNCWPGTASLELPDSWSKLAQASPSTCINLVAYSLWTCKPDSDGPVSLDMSLTTNACQTLNMQAVSITWRTVCRACQRGQINCSSGHAQLLMHKVDTCMML